MVTGYDVIGSMRSSHFFNTFAHLLQFLVKITHEMLLNVIPAAVP